MFASFLNYGACFVLSSVMKVFDSVSLKCCRCSNLFQALGMSFNLPTCCPTRTMTTPTQEDHAICQDPSFALKRNFCPFCRVAMAAAAAPKVSWECFTELKQWSPFTAEQMNELETLYQEMKADGLIKSYSYSYSTDVPEAEGEGAAANPAKRRRLPIGYKVLLIPEGFKDEYGGNAGLLIPGTEHVQIRTHP